jgi:hypothetical protein
MIERSCRRGPYGSPLPSQEKAVSGRYFLFIGEQTLDLLFIGLVGIGRHSEASLELRGLLVENVASLGGAALNLPVFGQLKSLFCTGVRFNLGHVDSPLSFISGAD